MSKLRQVRAALEGNSNITIVDVSEGNFLNGSVNGWSHTMDFMVAPKTGGVYDAADLQRLMLSLIPGLETSCRDDFRDRGDGGLKFGALYFDENIGVVRTHSEVVLTDEDVRATKGFTDGKLVTDNECSVCRRTWVRLYPSVALARAIITGECDAKYEIFKEDLDKYRK